jgi:periplasmic protein TonB
MARPAVQSTIMHDYAARPSPAGGSGAIYPSELRFLLPESKTNVGALVGGAGLSWSMIFLVLAFLMWLRPYQQMATALADFPAANLVYLEELGLSGGGGGGGNKSPAPPKMSEIPKLKAVEPDTVPVATPEPALPAETVIAAEASAITSSTTVVVLGPTTNTTSTSLGPGGPSGAGTGKGPGIGPGDGPGLGPGKGGNTGGDVFEPGPGISNPTLISAAKPSYTSEGMLRRVQGPVLLQCVVSRTGSVGSCSVLKSLDANRYGLDDQALKAAAQFRFNPGRNRQGEPVPVRVNIEITFNMR